MISEIPALGEGSRQPGPVPAPSQISKEAMVQAEAADMDHVVVHFIPAFTANPEKNKEPR